MPRNANGIEMYSVFADEVGAALCVFWYFNVFDMMTCIVTAVACNRLFESSIFLMILYRP